ncbi:outer membrane protein assembly factor BamB family protein [Streptomyces triticagri]|nr:PQQ-binding-like beta-propeller repeat protein [Streptomyces triticagri]
MNDARSTAEGTHDRRVGRLVTAALAGLVALLLAVTGCTSGDGGRAELPDGDKAPRPISYAEKALWTGRDLGLKRTVGAVLRGRTAVVTGDTAAHRSRLAVADAETGELRWYADGGDPLRGGDGAVVAGEYESYLARQFGDADGRPVVLDGADDGPVVLVPYSEERENGEEKVRGIAALSLKDGRVGWKRPLLRPKAGDAGDDVRDQVLTLLDADDGTVLVGVGADKKTALRTVALRASDGKVRWEYDGEGSASWAYRLAGDTVLGSSGNTEGVPWEEESRQSAVLALDAHTGKAKWDLGDRYDTSRLAAVVPGRAVLVTEGGSGSGPEELSRVVTVDTRTGRELQELDGKFRTCRSDGASLIGCIDTGDGSLATLRAPASGDRKGDAASAKGRGEADSAEGKGKAAFKAVEAERKPVDGGDGASYSLDAVHGDRLYVSGGKGIREEGYRHAAADRAGNVLRDELPGEALAFSSRYTAFLTLPERQDTVSDARDLVVHRAATGEQRPPEPRKERSPEVTPVEHGDRPLWSTGAGRNGMPQDLPEGALDSGLGTLQRVDLAGGVVIYAGELREDDDVFRIVVADPRTGKERWHRDTGKDLGEGLRLGGNLSIRSAVVGGELVVEYGKEDSEEEGIAGLSLRDGKLKWRIRLSDTERETASLEGSSGSTVITTVTGRADGGGADRVRTLAHDAKSGRKLWEADGLGARGITGELVVADRAADGRSKVGYGGKDSGSVVAVGLRDGRKKWSYEAKEQGTTGARTRSVSDRAVIVGLGADGSESSVVLTPDSGRRLTRTLIPLLACNGGEEVRGKSALVVCTAGRTGGLTANRFPVTVEIAADGRKATLRTLPRLAALDGYGATGRWLLAATDRRDETKYYAYDARGRRVGKALPGWLQETDGTYGIFTRGDIGLEPIGSGSAFEIRELRGRG